MEKLITKRLLLWITAWLLLPSAPVHSEIQFEDVTGAAGINYLEMSYGASWGDFNGDGWPDIWAGSHSEVPRLYLNNKDGTFAAVGGLNQFRGDNHGSAWADFDNDGDQDLLVLDGAVVGTGQDPNELLTNTAGVFTDESNSYGIDYPLSRGRTPLWFDWNNDGDLDVLVTAFPRADSLAPTALFTQENGVFIKAGMETGLLTSKANAFAQLGWNDSAGKPVIMIHGNTYPDSIYQFDSGSFVNITADYGFLGDTWETSDVVSADLNGDLLIDLFLVRNEDTSAVEVADGTLRARIRARSDEKGVRFYTPASISVDIHPSWIVSPTQIFIGHGGMNPSSLRFGLSPNDTDTHGIAEHSSGISKGVYIGYNTVDETWQILVSSGGRWSLNFLVDSSQPIEEVASINFVSSEGALRDTFLAGTGGAPKVVDMTSGSGLDTAGPCESAVAADFDNDMDLDLYLVCRNTISNEPNLLYENLGGGLFEPVVGAGGAAGSTLGRGESVTGGDYDLDGFIDLFITNGSGAPPFNIGPYQLFQNQGNSNHWLQLDLEGVESNRDGLGARVLLTSGGIKQLRIQDGGMHRFSQNHARLHFGLADHDSVDEIVINWPAGSRQVLTDVQPDQILEIVECTGPVLTSDVLNTDRGQPVTVDLLMNDTCLGNTPIVLDLGPLSNPAIGTLEMDTDTNRVTLTPTPSFAGRTSFTYMVSDARAREDAASVSVRVNDLPEAVSDSATTISGEFIGIDVLANDYGLSDGIASIRISAHPSSGAEAVIDDNLLIYSAPTGFVGIDSIEYTITDSDGDASVAMVTVEVSSPTTGDGNGDEPTVVDDDVVPPLPAQDESGGSALNLLIILVLLLIAPLRPKTAVSCTGPVSLASLPD